MDSKCLVSENGKHEFIFVPPYEDDDGVVEGGNTCIHCGEVEEDDN